MSIDEETIDLQRAMESLAGALATFTTAGGLKRLEHLDRLDPLVLLLEVSYYTERLKAPVISDVAKAMKRRRDDVERDLLRRYL